MSDTDWTFGGRWPYKPRFHETADGRLHYVDEGPRDGRPVVLVHGNPTWGFLYRNFIGPLTEEGHRVIVPDHLGFGRSDKPDDVPTYAIARHVDRLDNLLEALDLHDATVVAQDWGGPIGLSWAARHPERVAGLFILNTWAHVPPQKVTLPLPLRLFRTPVIGELLVKGLAGFHRGFLFNAGVVRKLDRATKQAYMAPHPTWSSRTGVLAFPRQIPVEDDGSPVAALNHALERDLRTHFRAKPVHVTWAMNDVAFVPEMLDAFWLRTFPNAAVTKLEGAGHYLQEDAHERIVPELLRFLAALPVRTAATTG